MAKKLFDYWCQKCENEFEALAHNNDEVKYCDYCGTPGKAIITPVRFRLDGTDPAFPTEWDKWDKRRQEKIKQEQKENAG